MAPEAARKTRAAEAERDAILMRTVHATTIALDGHGVLLRGPSGCGKSDLALRLLTEGAELVADDRTRLTAEDGQLFAQAPPDLAGLLEVRGVGIVRRAFRPRVALSLIVDLSAEVPRLPASGESETLHGVTLPRMALAAFEASAPHKLRLALETGAGVVPADPR